MEKSKQMVQELLFDEEPTQHHHADLKIDINNLLHMNLPPNVTIRECEVLAHVIHSMIVNPYEFLKKQTL